MVSTPRIDPRVAQTRELVLAAAADLLVVEGFDRITIESVAERCGVARSTIYRNWRSRGRLLVEAFDRLLGPVESADTGTLADDLRSLAHDYAAGLEREAWGEVFPSLVGAIDHDDDLRGTLAEFVTRRINIASAIFARAVDRGEIPGSTDVEAMTELFASPFFFRRLVSQRSIDDAFIDAHIGRVLRAVGGT